jgi:hypothetical protein
VKALSSSPSTAKEREKERKRERKKERKKERETIWVIINTYMEMSQGHSLCMYLKQK